MARMNHTSDTKGAWEEVSSMLPAFLEERDLTEDGSFMDYCAGLNAGFNDDDKFLAVVYDTWEGWQVVRYFHVVCVCGVSLVDAVEHTQYWFKDGARVGVDLCEMGRQAGEEYECYGNGPHQWVDALPMADAPLWAGCRFTEVNAKARLAEFAGRRGWNLSAWDIVGDFAGGIMETLHKVGKGEWVKVVFRCESNPREWFRRNAHVVRLALKHGHELKGMDIDHVRILEGLGMDTHNPSLLFPNDGGRMHDMLNRRLIRKREEEERKAEEKRRREKAERDMELIAKRMEVLGGYRIEGERFVLVPLITYDDYRNEGARMHHCVTSYFDHERSVVMTAVDKETGTHVETMEWKGNEMVQCRGVYNSDTEWHGEIVGMAMAHAEELTAMSRRMAS